MYEKLKKWKERNDKKEDVAFSLSHNHRGSISYFLHGKVGWDSWCILAESDSVKYKIFGVSLMKLTDEFFAAVDQDGVRFGGVENKKEDKYSYE